MENGWIKLHRKINENPIFKRSSYFHLWVALLLNANHKDNKMIWNGNLIVIKEGQLITGRKSLSEETGIPESTIEDILGYLETQQQIQQQKTTKYRLITILNWKDYQHSDIKSNNKTTTKQQQADTNKNDNKDKNVKNIPNETSSLIVEVIHLFEIINPAIKRMYGNSNQRKACQSLIDTYSFEKVKSVIEKTLPKTNTLEFFPSITTPLQLWDKWATLESQIEKYKNKIKSKQRNVII